LHTPLECFFAGFARTNTDNLLQVEDEDLAITNFSGTCSIFDRLYRTLDNRIVDRCLDFCLRRTSSSLNGLMMAVMSFISSSLRLIRKFW
jgi:hypothetical protein